METFFVIGMMKVGFIAYLGFNFIFGNHASFLLAVIILLLITKFRIKQLPYKKAEAWLEGCFLESKKCFIISHRGENSEAPENTLKAFEIAINKGVRAIELDLRLSKDHYIVVIHNPTVDATTDGTGKVSSFTLKELKALNITFKNKVTDQKIPTLEEVMRLCIAKNVRMVLDVKTVSHSMVKGLTELFRSQPAMYYLGLVVGFHPQFVYWTRRMDKNILTGLSFRPFQLSTDESGTPMHKNDLLRYYVCFITDLVRQLIFRHVSWLLIGNSFCLLHKSILCSSTVDEWKNKNILPIYWTLDNPVEKSMCTLIGCALISNSISNMDDWDILNN